MDRKTIICFQMRVHQLLSVHYGIGLSDTVLCDDTEVSRLIEGGVSPVSVVNDLVDKYHLEKLNASSYLPASPYVSESDELLAQIQLASAIIRVVTPD
ncbi:hypothetical protein FAP59_18315 [Morganella morganii]|nr:hypothetical protein [Morganella morganii]